MKSRLNRLLPGVLLLCSPLLNAQDLEARLGWLHRVELGTLASGIVEKVEVRAGQRVTKGDLLLALDGRSFQAEIAKAEAALSSASARLAEAKREDERAAELYDRTVLSDHEREMARIGLAEADAVARKARARLQLAKLNAEYSRIRAPFDAWVLAVDASVGQVVVSELQSRPLLVLAQAGSMQAEADVASTLAAGLDEGKSYSVAIGGEWYPATLLAVGLEASREDEREVYYPLRVGFQAPADKLLRAGQRVTLRIGD